MIAGSQIVQVEESVFPLLLYAEPGETYLQRLGQYLKRIYAGTGNINSPSLCMVPVLLWPP